MLELPLPQSLRSLLESGFWPMNAEQSRHQNLHPRIPADRIKAFVPDERTIYFYPPPFCTVQQLRERGERFWDLPIAALPEIDPERTLLLGDFGLGSDAPFALDYRRDIDSPSVIRLQWSPEGNHWVEIAPTFEAFASLLFA